METQKRSVFTKFLMALLTASLWLFSGSVFSQPVISYLPINIGQLMQQGTLPEWRSSGVFVEANNKIYLWGGYVQCFAPGCSQTFPNKVSTYSFNNKTWSIVPTTTPPPTGRTYVSMDVWKTPQGVPHIIIYGGLVFQPDFSQFISFSDMWDFNIAMKTWTKISDVASPGKRFGASFQIVGQKGYLFAGVEDLGGFQFVEHNDLWEYNFTTKIWTRLIADDPQENPIHQPGSRYRANFDYSASLNAIALFGGDRIVLPGQPDKPHRRDTWLLRLSPTPHWDKQSEEVDPVVDPISAILNAKHVVAFGDLEPQDDSQRCCSGPPSDPNRFCDDPVKNIFSNNHIDINTTHYTKFVNVNNTTALKRSAYVQISNKLYFWGGYNLQCSAPGANDGVLQKNTKLLVLDINSLKE